MTYKAGDIITFEGEGNNEIFSYDGIKPGTKLKIVYMWDKHDNAPYPIYASSDLDHDLLPELPELDKFGTIYVLAKNEVSPTS